jgi:1,2-diacylglycerol 3-alpha-glucosyltransferase
MNILIVTATYPPSANGVAISTKRSVEALRSLGHRVVVIGPNFPNSEKDLDYISFFTVKIPFFGLVDYPIVIPASSVSFARKLPKITWDVIHVHHPFFVGEFAVSLGVVLQTPVLFTYHTQYDAYLNHLTLLPEYVKKYLYKKNVLDFLNKLDGIIATTKWLQKDLMVKSGRQDVYYISTAGLPRSFVVQKSDAHLRAELGLPHKGPIFLSVSRLSPEKKTDILLRAFLVWAKTHPHGILIIIGDGSYRQTLESISRQHPQGKRILFVGKVPNEQLAPWYTVATVFLYSSVTDTIGINIIESMSAGVPVVAPDHYTTREIIQNHYNGILASRKSIAEQMSVALKKRLLLSSGAKKTADRYDGTVLTKKLLLVYEKVRKKKINTSSISLAQKALVACLTEFGFVAGAHHFVDLWARDSLFATFGVHDSRLNAASRKTIETFLSHQREDGLIPYLILRGKHTIGKYFGRHTFYKKPKAEFRSHLTFGTVPDGGVLTIIATRRYVEQTNDTAFLKKHYTKLVKAFAWYEHRFNQRLIFEWFACEWADALLKIGKTLYTNVLYWKAAEDIAWMAKKLKKTNESLRYQKRAARIAHDIRKEFWTGSYFADWVDYKRQDYFATHPNMLTIVLGLTTKKEATMILAHAKKTTWNGWTMRNSYPRYPLSRVPLLHLVTGMADYHNGLLWLQPGILYAMALKTVGNIREAKQVLQGIANHIVRHGGAHEVYEQDGSPVKRLFYLSEQPFAWSAGLFLWAHKEIFDT